MKYLIFISIVLINGCSEDVTTPPIGTADAIVIAEMINSETNKPVAYQDFSVSIMIDEVDKPISHGVVQTDEEGVLEVTLRSLSEEKGTGIIFNYGPENNRQSVSEEIEFNLNFFEPLDTLNLQLEF